jgi:hypothetical protein
MLGWVILVKLDQVHTNFSLIFICQDVEDLVLNIVNDLFDPANFELIV